MNEFARDTLTFHIGAFARELGIAPGIIVGRLQHDGALAPSQLNRLKRRLR